MILQVTGKLNNTIKISNILAFLIYNFSSSGTICEVCSKSIARRLGKQGYECRDCNLKCHKHCHVKVTHNCPSSTIHNIEL